MKASSSFSWVLISWASFLLHINSLGGSFIDWHDGLLLIYLDFILSSLIFFWICVGLGKLNYDFLIRLFNQSCFHCAVSVLRSWTHFVEASHTTVVFSFLNWCCICLCEVYFGSSLEFLLETGRGPFLLITIIRMYTVLRLPGGLWNEIGFTLLYTPVRYSVFPCGSDFLIYSGLPSRWSPDLHFLLYIFIFLPCLGHLWMCMVGLLSSSPLSSSRCGPLGPLPYSFPFCCWILVVSVGLFYLRVG